MNFNLIEADAPDTFEALEGLFREKAVNVDGLRLTPVDVTSPLFQALKTSRSPLFLVFEFRPPEIRHVTDLPDSYEEFMARRGTKTRQTFRNEFRVFEKRCGPLTWKSYETPDEVDLFLQAAVPVAEASWQSRDGLGSLTRSESSRERYRQWASNREFWGYTVHDATGKAMAFWMGRTRGDTLHPDKTGYDPAFVAVGPAKLLLYKSIEMELGRIPRRFKQINWGRGEQPYKRGFSTQETLAAEYWLLKRTARHAMWVQSRKAIRSIVGFIKRNEVMLQLKRRLISMPDRRPGALDPLEFKEKTSE